MTRLLLLILLGLTGCESAPTTRSTAVLPPVDKGAMQPYAETTTEPEPSLEPAVTTDERIVELIASADPAPVMRSDYQQPEQQPMTNWVKKHIRKIRYNRMAQ